MNEIEKMYENAGILKECLSPCYINKTWRKIHDCPNCDNRENYPPFTAENQLELIKWLGIRDEFNFYQNKVTKDWIFYDHEKDATHYNFELGLASWVNYLWQDLTEEEKQQVKGILE